MSKIKVDKEAQPIAVSSSEKKAAFKDLIERYKKQNPVKYAAKKEALEAKLNEL